MVKPATGLSGSRVRHLRERLGLTQVSFSTLLGVDLWTVKRWERGVSRMHGSTLHAELLRRLEKAPLSKEDLEEVLEQTSTDRLAAFGDLICLVSPPRFYP